MKACIEQWKTIHWPRLAIALFGPAIAVAAFGFLAMTPTPSFAACQDTRPFGAVEGITVDSGDALFMLKDIAGLEAGQGLPLTYCGPEDVDCNGRFDAVDALKVLRYVAGLPYSQVQPCPKIGEVVEH